MEEHGYSPQRRLALLRGSALVLLAAGCTPAAVRPPMKRRIAQGVGSVAGSAWIDGRPLRPDDLIVDGATITTAPASRLIFIRGSNAYLLRGDSSLTFRAGLDGGMEVDLERGGLLSVFAPGEATIRTPIANIGIRGTGCYVESHPQKSYICLCYGAGDIRLNRDGRLLKSIQTTHHDSPYNIYPDGELMAPMPVINHTDEELILLEAIVGREPPFVGVEDDYW